jgi:hypothetical protein
MRVLTDGVGQPSDRYDYAAFGEVIERTGTTANPYTFAGERFDPATALDLSFAPATTTHTAGGSSAVIHSRARCAIQCRCIGINMRTRIQSAM